VRDRVEARVRQQGVGHATKRVTREISFAPHFATLERQRNALEQLDEQVRLHPGIQYTNLRFDERIQDAWVIIVLLTAAVAEQLINGYLLLRCEKNGNVQRFAKLEREPFLEKWTRLPATLVPAYSFSMSSPLYNDLSCLKDRRDAITHPKIQYRNNGILLHEGTDTGRQGYDVDIVFLRGCCTLPARLADHLCAAEDDQNIRRWLKDAARVLF
jgi:hypothetical protein